MAVKIGDLVRVISTPEESPRDSAELKAILRACVGRTFPMIDFLKGFIEFEVGEVVGEEPYMHSIWIERECIVPAESSQMEIAVTLYDLMARRQSPTKPPMTKPVLVFDLDGTLAETAGDLMGALNVILAREGLDPVPLESARTMLGAGGKALIARGFARAGRALAADKHQLLFEDFLAHYNAHIADNSWLFPGVVEALDRAAAEGYRLAVCTNKLERSSRLLLGKLGIAERFTFICGQDTFGVAKPDPTPLIETIASVGGALNRAIMVGDSRTDIDTARAAGIPVIAVDFGYTDVPVSELGPDRVISRFEDLFGEVEALFARARHHGEDA